MNASSLHRILPAAGLAALVALVAVAAVPERGADVADALVEKFRERNGAIFKDWPAPQAVLVVVPIMFVLE